jgi:hypothetical protein
MIPSIRAALSGFAAVAGCAVAAPVPAQVDVRLENFTVMPSTGPVVNAWIRNRSTQPLQATIRAQWPEGWKVQSPPPVTLPAGAIGKAAFTIEKASDSQENVYPVTLEVEAGGKTDRTSQQVLVATAPYLKPKVDGQLDDWKDAVPIRFTTAGKATTVMTCWNRQQFCLAVCMEEETPGTAIQFALTPRRASDNGVAGNTSNRYEFLVLRSGTASEGGSLLLKPGDDLNQAAQIRPLELLRCPEMQIAINHSGKTTICEIVLPLSLMPELRATPGRTFGFSLLVHDADGNGLRDLGTVMRLWPDQRQPLSWCRWPGSYFGTEPPFDSNIEFGFSSSIH